MTKEEIGKILKSAREHVGLTQAQVALKLGKRQQVIGNWETGYAQPDANTLFVLCDMYGISIDDTFGGGRHVKVTTAEMDIIRKYRALDAHGQKAIAALLDIELERCRASAASLSIEDQYRVAVERYASPAEDSSSAPSTLRAAKS